MKRKLISSLSTFINENRSEEIIEAIEEIVVDSFDKIAKEESFYQLPTNRILKIVGKSKIDDVEVLCKVISMMCENKGDESVLLLNVIDPKKATFDDCIKVISKFVNCPICKRTGGLFEEYKNFPRRDNEHKIEELKKEFEKTKKNSNFSPVTKQPADFESDICKAAGEGKFSSVQYLVEQCHVDAETKDKAGYTPINIASSNGHLEVVKYLYEACRANVETKNNDGNTPISNASIKGHLDIVKYLYETCHANAETKSNYGNRPINLASSNGHFEVVKYLHETCHVDAEAKNKYGRSSINLASINGHLEIVKYLYETCHVDVSGKTFTEAKQNCRQYLLSKSLKKI